ncbi:Zn-ribbon domain-containing OB-fold protein [Streptomyces sp. NPDC102340]|uniref:Zn-ribbon domain-containing OB-fold protein n=1 Tax=unclassified Streptomyces TaxID=2593676 RepID=UPI003801E43A
MSAPRPVPVPDAQSAPYWEAAARHTLVLARCGRCSAFALPPGVTCPHCHTTDPDFSYEQVSGRGTVRSWTVVRQSALPGLADEVPFALVDVELDEQAGLRMIGRLLDGPNSPLRVGDRVRVAFEDVAAGVSVPAFTLGEVAS